MDRLSHFRREILAFESAVRRADAAMVPSCPGWAVADLVMHLGGTHRYVSAIVGDRLAAPPPEVGLSLLGLPADLTGWPDPARAPNAGPLVPGLVEWFAAGAAELAERFAVAGPDVAVWTWSPDRSVGFWIRMQTIEAAVHRWDAENATGDEAAPVNADLAADAVTQTFEVMAPFRRTLREAPPGAGETYCFRRTDGPGSWRVRFDGEKVLLDDGTGGDVELTGTASDLMLFLWRRIPADRLDVRGDRSLLDSYFTLVPPV
jgi:uncharacterized protein (TIGR03083 family)